MRKLILTSALVLASAGSAVAGGYLTNTNQSVSYLRNPARLATFSLDGAYSNPAGLAWIGEGWHISFTGQNAAQDRDILSTYGFFAGNVNQLGNNTKLFHGEASAPFIPSLDAAYQKGPWTVSMHFGITGGGGKATFNSGLPMFESQVAVLPTLLAGKGLNADAYDCDMYMQGRQYIYGIQLGLTYKIFENYGALKQGLSAHLGARMNFASNHYEGYLRNISARLNGQMVGLNGYTLCSGIICEELNGSEYRAVPFREDEHNRNTIMQIGYVVKKHSILSDIADVYITEVRRYLSACGELKEDLR